MVRLLTGHLREGAAKEAASGDDGAVADAVDFAVTSADLDSLVVYMGLPRSRRWRPSTRVRLPRRYSRGGGGTGNRTASGGCSAPSKTSRTRPSRRAG